MARLFALALGAITAIGACSGDDAPNAQPDVKLPDRVPPTGTAADGGGNPLVGGPDGAPVSPYVDFDVNHVLITGQSNSVSNGATDILSTTQPFGNLMFDTGVMPMKGGFTLAADHTTPRIPGCDGEGCTAFETPTKLVPLVEGDPFFDYAVETPAAGVANGISHLATTRHGKAKHDVLVSIHGRSGNTYQCLRKGGCNYKPDYLGPFEQGMEEVKAAKGLVQGKSYVVRAVLAIHGESDHHSYFEGTQEFPSNGTDGTPNAIADYGAGLVEWQRDYETSIKAITSQTIGVPLLISQISGWTNEPTSRVAQWQLDAHVKAPGKVVLVGPAYALALREDDCQHFTSVGARRLGEYFAKVYAQIVFEGRAWEPLRPKAVTRDGAVITVTFHVPKPPLVIDTTRVAAASFQGFTFAETGGTPAMITKVDLAGPDTVKITLSAVPSGTDKRLRYAMNQPPAAQDVCIGSPTGARGNLRDSDDTPSKDGYDLQNWAVHFDLPVP